MIGRDQQGDQGEGRSNWEGEALGRKVYKGGEALRVVACLGDGNE